MIVNYKKENAGVLVLPCMQNNLVVKQMYILPGCNDVPDEDWFMARETAKRYIKRGDLEEFKKEVVVKIASAASSEETDEDDDSDDDSDGTEFLTMEDFPHVKIVAILKEIELYEGICAAKKEETGKATLTKKWLINYLSDEEEAWDKVYAVMSKAGGIASSKEKKEEESEVTITSVKLSEMDSKVATDIITDTYNMDTLEKWKDEVGQPDLRVLILNQMEIVQKPTVKNKGRKK